MAAQLDGRLDAGTTRRVFLDWARSRKFTGRELVDSGICYLREEGNAQSGIRVRFRDRLMFPIRNEIGDVIAFSGRQLRADPNSGKYVNSPETFMFRKSKVLFALDRAKKPILQGKGGVALRRPARCDLMPRTGHRPRASRRWARPSPASTRGCCAATPAMCWSVMTPTRRASPPPNGCSANWCRRVSSVRVVCMPAGDDPDTYLKSHGVDAFRQLLAEAKEFFDFKLENARAQGTLDTAAGRAAALTDCAEILSLVSDFAARENQINGVATHLQTSVHGIAPGDRQTQSQTPTPAQRGHQPVGRHRAASRADPAAPHRRRCSATSR